MTTVPDTAVYFRLSQCFLVRQIYSHDNSTLPKHFSVAPGSWKYKMHEKDWGSARVSLHARHTYLS